MPVLTAENISKRFGDKEILKNVSVTLNEGELVCLLGVSGAGKTTLFNIIAGLTAPDSGTVTLNGKDITSCPGSVSYMLQKDLLLRHKKVIDNVSLPLVIKGKSKSAARERANALFETFGLEGTQQLYPSELSGGMRQRAALMRTYLACDGGAALLDEPFSALDAITKSAMHRWYLEMMAQLKLSTLFITHDIDEAIKLSDRVLLLSGAPADISAEIIIETPRNMRGADFDLSDEFVDYKRSIITRLGRI